MYRNSELKNPRASPGTGRGDRAHREPLVEVGNAPGARQGRGDPRRRGSGFRSGGGGGW